MPASQFSQCWQCADSENLERRVSPRISIDLPVTLLRVLCYEQMKNNEVRWQYSQISFSRQAKKTGHGQSNNRHNPAPQINSLSYGRFAERAEQKL
jgi:hypothetical protein